MQSKITLMGMYNFDDSLFEELTFPSGIDADLAISRILEKSEEFELVYSDFGYLKERIGIWGKLWERTFDKWIKALQVEYDPLFNYDRTEEYTDTKGRAYKDKQNSILNSSGNSHTVTGSSSDSESELKVSAYDEDDYSEKNLETGNAKTNQYGSGDSNSVTASGSDTEGTSNEIMKHTAHLYGNIGVTTSQQMLKDELDIATWNLYEHISDIFIDEFCILVY